MQPINILPFLSKGIVVFFPDTEINFRHFIKLEIYYSENNPLFDWVNCNNSELKLWEHVIERSPSGSLFLYETNDNLNSGFYTIKGSILSEYQPKVGQLIVGLIQPTPYLAIGIPYSMYPPITLI